MMYQLILALVLAVYPPVLSLSTTEAQPAQTIEATAVGEGLTLVAPDGFTVSPSFVEAGVTHWRVQAGSVPSLTPYRIELWQDGALVDVRSVRICCEAWKRGAVLWLPVVVR